MAVSFIQGDDFALFAPEDEEAKSALSNDPAIMGMQLAMLQPSAPRQLIDEASKCFQRSWFEAVVTERASDKRCGWPPCEASMQADNSALGSSKARQRLAEKKSARTGDDRENYCSGACREVALRFASTLPFRRAALPQGVVDPHAAARAAAAEKARLDALRGSNRKKAATTRKRRTAKTANSDKPGAKLAPNSETPKQAQTTNKASGFGLGHSYAKWDGILKSFSEGDESVEKKLGGVNKNEDEGAHQAGTVVLEEEKYTTSAAAAAAAASSHCLEFVLLDAPPPPTRPPHVLKAAEDAAAAAISGGARSTPLPPPPAPASAADLLPHSRNKNEEKAPSILEHERSRSSGSDKRSDKSSDKSKDGKRGQAATLGSSKTLAQELNESFGTAQGRAGGGNGQQRLSTTKACGGGGGGGGGSGQEVEKKSSRFKARASAGKAQAPAAPGGVSFSTTLKEGREISVQASDVSVATGTTSTTASPNLAANTTGKGKGDSSGRGGDSTGGGLVNSLLLNGPVKLRVAECSAANEEEESLPAPFKKNQRAGSTDRAQGGGVFTGATGESKRTQMKPKLMPMRTTTAAAARQNPTAQELSPAEVGQAGGGGGGGGGTTRGALTEDIGGGGGGGGGRGAESIEGYTPRRRHDDAPAFLSSCIRSPFNPPPDLSSFNSSPVSSLPSSSPSSCASPSAEASASSSTPAPPSSPLPATAAKVPLDEAPSSSSSSAFSPTSPPPPPLPALPADSNRSSNSGSSNLALCQPCSSSSETWQSISGDVVGNETQMVADLSFHVLSASQLDKVIEADLADGAAALDSKLPAAPPPPAAAAAAAARGKATEQQPPTAPAKQKEEQEEEQAWMKGALEGAAGVVSGVAGKEEEAARQGYRAVGADPIGAAAIWDGGENDGGYDDDDDDEDDDEDGYGDDDYGEEGGGGGGGGWETTPFMTALDALMGWRTLESDALVSSHLRARLQQQTTLSMPPVATAAIAEASTTPPAALGVSSSSLPVWSHPSVSTRRSALKEVLQREKSWLQHTLFGLKSSSSSSGSDGGKGGESVLAVEAAVSSGCQLVDCLLPLENFPYSVHCTAAVADLSREEEEEEATSADGVESAREATMVAFWRLVALVLVVVAWPPVAVPIPLMATRAKTGNGSRDSRHFPIELPNEVSEELGVGSDEFAALCDSFLDGSDICNAGRC